MAKRKTGTEVDFEAALRRDGQSALEARDPYDVAALRERFMEYLGRIEEVARQAEAHEVRDEASVSAAVPIAGQAKALAKAIDERRRELVERPNQYVRAVNNLARQFTDRLEAAERGLKAKLAEYQHRLELLRREAERAAQERARALEAELKAEAEAHGVEAPQVPMPVLPKPETVVRTDEGMTAYTRKVWTFAVVDEAQVPREYLSLDRQKVLGAIRAGVREIPGLRIYEETQVSIRT